MQEAQSIEKRVPKANFIVLLLMNLGTCGRSLQERRLTKYPGIIGSATQ